LRPRRGSRLAWSADSNQRATSVHRVFVEGRTFMNVRIRKLAPIALGGVVAIVGLTMTGAFAAPTHTDTALSGGQSLSVSCSGSSLSWAPSDATDGVLTCAGDTTTTTAAPTTTTSTTSTTVAQPSTGSGGCGLAQAAFCETFDQPTVNGPANSRAGTLNGVLWGTSYTVGGMVGQTTANG